MKASYKLILMERSGLKRIFFLFYCLTFITFAYSQPTTEEKWVETHYLKKDFMIPMRDGIELYTVVYMPKDTTEKHPILFNRTPYSCNPYEKDKFYPGLWEFLYPYMKEGYIYVQQDVRGKFMSEGSYENIRPFLANKKGTEIDEASDTYDTADWLIKNLDGNNGKIGVFGISYPGFYALMAGAAGHPAIKAVSPQAPVFNWFIGDDFHHNGAFFIKDAFSFMDSFDKVRKKTTTKWPKSSVFYEGSDYDFFLNKSIKYLTDKYFGQTRPFWNDMMNHPDFDEWWKARVASNACYHVKPAVLIVGGLFDAEDCYGAWNAYGSIRRQSPSTDCRLVFGPWYHGGWSRCAGDSLGEIRFGSKTSDYYMQNFELPFFNYYLKGEGSLDSLGGANIFFSGENRWKHFESWPLKTKETDLYLSGRDSLSFTKPTGQDDFSEYISDPSHPVPYDSNIRNYRTAEYIVRDQRFLSGRKDVLSFQTGVLDKDISLAGGIKADLQVAISTTDADFVVKIIDVFPEGFRYADRPERDMGGYEMLVRADIFRGRYRKSFSKPEAFQPGEITRIEYSLPDIAHTFRKGHRIMVQIQSSWFPLADMNPQQFVNIYQCSSSDFVSSDIKIYRNTLHASKIILPVLDR